MGPSRGVRGYPYEDPDDVLPAEDWSCRSMGGERASSDPPRLGSGPGLLLWMRSRWYPYPLPSLGRPDPISRWSSNTSESEGRCRCAEGCFNCWSSIQLRWGRPCIAGKSLELVLNVGDRSAECRSRVAVAGDRNGGSSGEMGPSEGEGDPVDMTESSLCSRLIGGSLGWRPSLPLPLLLVLLGVALALPLPGPPSSFILLDTSFSTEPAPMLIQTNRGMRPDKIGHASRRAPHQHTL